MSSESPKNLFKRSLFPQYCSIIAKVYNFSDKTSTVKFLEDKNGFLDQFSISVYANGYDLDTQGYVSLIITSHWRVCHDLYQNFAFSCVVSVIDSEKKERFTRSFACNCEYLNYVLFEIGNYLARSSLIEASSECLLNNCLTIHVGIIFHNLTLYTHHQTLFDFSSSVTLEESNDTTVGKLNLDSVVGKHLYEASTFFKDMMDLTSEKNMEIPLSLQELHPFMCLCLLVMGYDCFSFISLEQLCQVYELADKYDIPSAVETCRILMKLYCDLRMKDEAFDEFSSKEGELMLRVADMSGDDYLKEIRNNFLLRNHAYFKEKGEIEWKCEIVEFESTDGFKLNITLMFTKKDHHEKFNFYSGKKTMQVVLLLISYIENDI